ncbi:hypothetical protein [Pararcticibacter amylolyticus]|uniref:DUF2383 domain-containing protein n=1 Tax=Pararcticibacter amylolyticus TaxID=2173175 RepID=A0A2U2PIA3_9SPHI|nr:hypothetical protein [Pararcticibacter amylolyticus]PWG80879.1 hypothetical protein DDR33_10545 [Pararcticibacter amylolyticus]
MEQKRLIIKVQQLLSHSVLETDFYDRATDQIIAPELKSAFAKYLWIRGEHIVGIKTYLLRTNHKYELPSLSPLQNERLWNFFIESVNKKDNPAILNTGIRYVRLTLNRYNNALLFSGVADRVNGMLLRHFQEIQNILQEFSLMQNRRRVF